MAEWYHFKVMELRTHEDTKDFSECKLKFHFMHDMIVPQQRDYLKKFDWDINSKPVQRLFLSRDSLRMMEVLNDFSAII